MLAVFKKLLNLKTKNKPDLAAKPRGIWAGFLDKVSAPLTYLYLLNTRHKVARYSTSNKIALTILTDDFEVFKTQTAQAEKFADYVQIDVMDGQLVSAKSFSERAEINNLNSPLKWELHLMVKDPIKELATWRPVENIFRAIFHIEGVADPQAVIAKIKSYGWEAGIALSPQTNFGTVVPYANLVNVILFLTVAPGRQGNPFRPEVGEKIKQLKQCLKKQTKKIPLIAVDGGVKLENIQEIKSWGVDIFNVGSTLTKAKDMGKVYEQLLNKLS
ncbi:MAG: hypothetical protein A3J93_02800 [Candidatus Magasanikbacteria bacterium RIFOXYC2_FULL_42_28]|uniref:Ribulose-phosphate 3-epimerase n=1 Tax=Candidatus Magasanikbacteria bacterium RIFOXYC2_FULL_42_28 TaxID=1798704 RepID=A0A1F6NU48_9BACT|nr:MAG: hypothetical protein A3J93_02800 [Candidatus Magasanikbacteria bacterium RIFOXYC2_FULL_42_28]